MNRISALLALLFCLNNTCISQNPQFAVVKPNGISYICPTWDSAYNKSVDGDFIYLPGTTISGQINIAKKLSIFGTGHYPDSTAATGRTIFIGTLNISNKVYLEGFECQSVINITASGNNSSFIRIRTDLLVLNGTIDHYINQCIINQIGVNAPCSPSSNLLISNSIMINGIQNVINSVVQNCIFMGSSSSWRYLTSSNTTYKNNIFYGRFGTDWYPSSPCYSLLGNNSMNNVFSFLIIGNDLGGNFTNVSPNSIFSYLASETFDYQNNYHLQPNSAFLSAGTDGSQIGIFGGTTPYVEGAVPSNPHIYFKQVAPQTNNNGQLQIQFKVRTSN